VPSGLRTPVSGLIAKVGPDLYEYWAGYDRFDVSVKAKDCRTRVSTVAIALDGPVSRHKGGIAEGFHSSSRWLWKCDRQMSFGRRLGTAAEHRCASLWHSTLGEDGTGAEEVAAI